VHIKGTCNITVDGTANLMASEINIDGAVNIKGDVDITGQITASGDVVGSGISLKTHVHGGVQSGGSRTSVPQ
jgi:phage baseplate assembly protein V